MSDRHTTSETYQLTFHGPAGLASFFNCLLALGWFWTDRSAPVDHIQTPLTAWLAWEAGLAPSALHLDDLDQGRVRASVQRIMKLELVR